MVMFSRARATKGYHRGYLHLSLCNHISWVFWNKLKFFGISSIYCIYYVMGLYLASNCQNCEKQIPLLSRVTFCSKSVVPPSKQMWRNLPIITKYPQLRLEIIRWTENCVCLHILLFLRKFYYVVWNYCLGVHLWDLVLDWRKRQSVIRNFQRCILIFLIRWIHITKLKPYNPNVR